MNPHEPLLSVSFADYVQIRLYPAAQEELIPFDRIFEMAFSLIFLLAHPRCPFPSHLQTRFNAAQRARDLPSIFLFLSLIRPTF